MPENNKEICFVIMPFSQTTKEHTGRYWTEHYEKVLKPCIEQNSNLKADRSKALRGDIVRQIITDLVVSRVTIADLTDCNPNVYWELGIRQSFKHGTITIAEEGTVLPFDISSKGTLFYCPKNHIKMADFCRDFKESIEDCLKNPERPDSAILETLSGRGTLFEIFRKDEAVRRLDAVISECDRNLEVLDDTYRRVRLNQKEPSGRTFITSRFRVSAVELLIISRYIDEDRPFFDLADRCLRIIVGINDQLNMWEFSPDATEKWLLRREKTARTQLALLRKDVEEARQKLSKRL